VVVPFQTPYDIVTQAPGGVIRFINPLTTATSFTLKVTPSGGSGGSGQRTFYGSNDHVNWTTVSSATSAIPDDSTFHTYNNTGLFGTYQYYKLGTLAFAGTSGSTTMLLTDWIFTFSAAALARRRMFIDVS
jgi:hypothetical protein